MTRHFVHVGMLPYTLGAAFAGSVGLTDPYNCQGQLFLGRVAESAKKGLTVDDTTAANCSGQLLEYWPQSSPSDYMPSKRVKLMRLFRAWAPEWPEVERYPAWTRVASYIRKHDVGVLVGTTVSCSEDEDKQSWQWTKELLTLIGREHVIGLSIGNELDIWHLFRKELKVDDACLHRLWDGGYTLKWFRRVVFEFDAMGFKHVPVTTALAGLAVAGKTLDFWNEPEARVHNLLSKLVSDYGERFVFAFNLYPYFDPKSKLDPNTDDQCAGTLSHALCWESECNLPKQIAATRAKITHLTGNPKWRMWLTEVGWASKYKPTLKSAMRKCPQFSSVESLLTFYKGFLAWDLSISSTSQPLEPPEYAFWHSMRDSPQLGTLEHFGLVANCDDLNCKTVQDPSMLRIPQPPPGFNPDQKEEESEIESLKEGSGHKAKASLLQGDDSIPYQSQFSLASLVLVGATYLAIVSAVFAFFQCRKMERGRSNEALNCETESESD